MIFFVYCCSLCVQLLCTLCKKLVIVRYLSNCNILHLLFPVNFLDVHKNRSQELIMLE